MASFRGEIGATSQLFLVVQIAPRLSGFSCLVLSHLDCKLGSWERIHLILSEECIPINAFIANKYLLSRKELAFLKKKKKNEHRIWNAWILAHDENVKILSHFPYYLPVW